MTSLRMSAPKADALPGCATPRHAEPLSFPAVAGASGNVFRGNERQNKAGTGNQSPGIVPNHVAVLFPPYRSLTRKDRNRIRKALRARDGDNCCWCSEPMEFGIAQHHRRLMGTIEHRVPRSDGGSDDLDNLALAHRICNQLRTAHLSPKGRNHG